MATERINTIVKEVIELDPSLQAHEVSLRIFVEHMDTARPDINVDTAFIAALRTRILQGNQPIVSPYANLSWWALRLMPIGAVALLLLMIIPPTLDTDGPRSIPEMTASDPRILDIEIGGTQGTAPQVELYGSGGGEEASPEAASIMDQRSMVTDQSVPTLDIPPQRPGEVFYIDTLTVSEPSFLVIQSKTTGGEMSIGTSPLLRVGTTDNLTITLRVPMMQGGAYRVVQYPDNGDQVFTVDDQIETGVYGNILSTPITLLSE